MCAFWGKEKGGWKLTLFHSLYCIYFFYSLLSLYFILTLITHRHYDHAYWFLNFQNTKAIKRHILKSVLHTSAPQPPNFLLITASLSFSCSFSEMPVRSIFFPPVILEIISYQSTCHHAFVWLCCTPGVDVLY